MTPPLIELALKRQRLQLKAAAQRLRLAQQLQILAPVLSAADKARSAGRWLKAHPQWLAGAAVALLVLRPRAALRWLRRGFFAWQALRRARAALRDLMPAR